MKIHTKVTYQMTDSGLTLVSDESFNYKGKVTDCKGGGGSDCPPPAPPPTPQYEYRPQGRADAALAGVAATGPNQAPAGIAGLPGVAQPGPGVTPPNVGRPGGSALPPLGQGAPAQYVNPIEQMQSQNNGNQFLNQINQYDPNDPYNKRLV
jgi:hypothetical protein